MRSLEQRCIAPGHWMIEGHEVIQTRPNGYWSIFQFNQRLKTFGHLRRCREWIADQVFAE